jgi:hypothetical protein
MMILIQFEIISRKFSISERTLVSATRRYVLAELHA